MPVKPAGKPHNGMLTGHGCPGRDPFSTPALAYPLMFDVRLLSQFCMNFLQFLRDFDLLRTVLFTFAAFGAI